MNGWEGVCNGIVYGMPIRAFGTTHCLDLILLCNNRSNLFEVFVNCLMFLKCSLYVAIFILIGNY